MKQAALQTTVQGIVLFLLMFSLASISDADELSSRIEANFEADSAYRFLAYESVEHAHTDEYGAMRYLVMDFDVALASRDIQGDIHTICSAVLQDRELIKDLSQSGYDMLSVSFDRQSQYDCL